MEKSDISKGLCDADLAGTCGFESNDAGTSGKSDTGLTRSNPVSFSLPTIRKLLATREGPLVDILRRQLSSYERGDAESRAALKPMILAAVERLSLHQLRSA